MKPPFCPSQRSKSCEGTNFDPVDDTVTRHDYQEIKIQENTQVLGVGVIPRSILVVLKDDLVDNVKAGGIKTFFYCFCSMHQCYRYSLCVSFFKLSA